MELDISKLKTFLEFHNIKSPTRSSHFGRLFWKRFPDIAQKANPRLLPWTVGRVANLIAVVEKLEPKDYQPLPDLLQDRIKSNHFPDSIKSKKQAYKYTLGLADYWGPIGVKYASGGKRWKLSLQRIFSQCPSARQAARYEKGKVTFDHLNRLLRFMSENDPATLVIEQRPSRQKKKIERVGANKTFDDFYNSWEWRRLRMKTIKEQGLVCNCCSARKGDRTIGGEPVRFVVDHIKPIRHHWHLRLDPANLQVLCDECNMGKGSWDETDWRDDGSILDDEPMTEIERQLGERMY